MDLPDIDIDAVLARQAELSPVPDGTLESSVADGDEESQVVAKSEVDSAKVVEDAQPEVKAKPDSNQKLEQHDDTRIPKARLDAQIAKTRQAEQAIAERDRQLEETRREIESLKRAEKKLDPQEVNSEGQTKDDIGDRIARLEAWEKKTAWDNQVATARQEMDSTIDAVLLEYPDVERNDLYGAILANQEADLWAVAQRIDERDRKVAARALERAGHQGQPSQTSVPTKERPAPIPRPQTSPTPARQQEAKKKDTRGMDWDELERHTVEQIKAAGL